MLPNRKVIKKSREIKTDLREMKKDEGRREEEREERRRREKERLHTSYHQRATVGMFLCRQCIK